MNHLATTLVAAALLPVLAGCGQDGQDNIAPSVPDTTVAPSATPSATGTPEPTVIADPAPEERIAMAAVEIVRVETTGGMCVSGGEGETEGTPCSSTLVIHGDGSWTSTAASNDTTREGMLSFEETTRLVRLLFESDATDHPKKEHSCDSWVDGQDVTLTYIPADGAREGSPVSISSCDYDLSGSRLMSFLSTVAA